MATADELLMAAAKSTAENVDEILTVDLNTRVISIPTSIRVLGVESDDDVKRLLFKIPRYSGEFDLSEFDVRVNFENARGTGDFYPVNDVEIIDDDTLSFSWLVDRVAFARTGDVKFSICMKLYDSTGLVIKELNTTFASLPVLEGLETEKALIDQNPSAFNQLMYRLYAVEAATGNGQNGYYSVIKVAQTDTGALFTINNQDGETIAYVRHGNDGYSPVRGVDYWTIDDETKIKQSIVEYTSHCINTWVPAYKTVTLSVSGWSNNVQTVAIEGVTANSVLVVSPKPDINNYEQYVDNNIRCIDQGTNSMVFMCGSVPSINIIVNVAIYHSNEEFSNNKFTVYDDNTGNIIIA